MNCRGGFATEGRIRPDELDYKERKMLEGHTWIVGVDEAGRGPLAGPVVAAAVILDPARPIYGLKDSKQLSSLQRTRLHVEIKQHAICYHIAMATVEEIDEINILQATMLAMKRAVEGLAFKGHEVWIDGNRAPDLSLPVKTFVQGDQLYADISAASILAKVARDEIMLNYAKQYPGYGFETHKGYPTKDHMSALAQFGVLPIHRKTFGPVRKALENDVVA
jgi:ribonuclease HII